MVKKFFNINYLILFSLLYIFLSSEYFALHESVFNGGSDGRYYYLISKYFPNFGENIEYIKGERFLIPYLIGFISKSLNIDTFLTYRIIVFFNIFLFIYLTKIIFDELKINYQLQAIYLILVIFNPYLFRFFISIPILNLDFFFLISLQIIILGIIKKKINYIYIGLFLSIACRQNGILILISLIICKFIFKKKSILSFKNLTVCTIITITMILINNYYSLNSSDLKGDAERLYLLTIFGIFMRTNFNTVDYVKFILFPLLSYGPIILLIIYQFFKLKLKFEFNELNIFLLSTTLFLVGIAFIGGPGVTGKNLLRLSNYCYFNIIILSHLMFDHKLSKIYKNFHLFLILIFSIFWSMHPSFSKFNIFSDLRVIFN